MLSLSAVLSLNTAPNLSQTRRLNMSLHMRNRTHVLAPASKPSRAPSLNTPSRNIARSLHTPRETSPNLRRINSSELTERRARTTSWRAGSRAAHLVLVTQNQYLLPRLFDSNTIRGRQRSPLRLL